MDPYMKALLYLAQERERSYPRDQRQQRQQHQHQHQHRHNPLYQMRYQRPVYSFPVVDGDEGYDIDESYEYGYPGLREVFGMRRGDQDGEFDGSANSGVSGVTGVRRNVSLDDQRALNESIGDEYAQYEDLAGMQRYPGVNVDGRRAHFVRPQREVNRVDGVNIADLVNKVLMKYETDAEADAEAAESNANEEDDSDDKSKQDEEGAKEYKSTQSEKVAAPNLIIHSDSKKPETSHSYEEGVTISAPQHYKKDLPFSPECNIYEYDSETGDESKYIIVLSIPGADKNSIDIDYHGNTNEVIIKGEIKNEYCKEEGKKSLIIKLSEQRFGKFERVVKLPSFPGIQETKIKAKFINGMLEINVPKIDMNKVRVKPLKITLEDVVDEELERESQEFI